MQQSQFPVILAGPILRRITPERVTIWLASSCPIHIKLSLHPEEGTESVPAPGHQQSFSTDELCKHSTVLKAGQSLYFYLLDIPVNQPLPRDAWIGYDLQISTGKSDGEEGSSNWKSWREWAPDICYPGRTMPGFVIRSSLDRILHGSCRKPHHPGGDGLVRADQVVSEQLGNPAQWPSALVMTGDQIYADDVAGPMLVAIHRLIAQLGLPSEHLQKCEVEESDLIHGAKANYYQRESLLPKTEAGNNIKDLIFGGARKPVFTSVNAHNHLITLAEVLGMYLLVWSPACWAFTDMTPPESLTQEARDLYLRELAVIEQFQTYLDVVRRVMAHLPVAMIFDDHDITDDWNLTAGWEQVAYGHPLSRRIIGNALFGYLICQGLGNAPENFPAEMMEHAQSALLNPGTEHHDNFIDELYRFSHWHYIWDTEPALIVMDTRTHRWRSERSLNQPSGLMDWEALTELQQELLDHKAVVLVSPAPMFGVKLIETIQRVFTWFGHPLVVDAENWMAHSGAAYALMNLFRHSRTPQQFIILSGDVHYSFVYDIELRGHTRGPDIWQITSSGIRNEFPKWLLEVFDRLNRWLYAPWSPLNWFTKRRGMRVIPHKPVPAAAGERLVNASGIGWVELKPDGSPGKAVQLCADGQDITFRLHEEEARWE
ncbi:alkaline phosphatase D family protein [Hahella ganghwensis]|uniref:alkaline phosphatase D family protein n=1 Tax=Hahella ganghwensis TaxID=286420 RepID=UPI00036D3B04|nr:alkaline phosphatase D family protein [Hahella ganghwensis]